MFADLRARVVTANRAIADAGLVVLTFGNASALDRAAGVVAIKPSGVDVGELLPRDVPVVDLESGAVVAGSRRPSSDTPTHLALYRGLPEIGGVVHTHSPFATTWAQACRELPCLGTTHADHFRGAVPVTRELTAAEIEAAYEEETGAVIVAAAQPGVPAALVASHGPFVWGETIEDAVANAVALEEVAASAYRALGLASGTEPIAGALLDKHFERKHGGGAYYGQPA
jgi:L-ribulose-5-phosphate 4-epimerase